MSSLSSLVVATLLVSTPSPNATAAGKRLKLKDPVSGLEVNLSSAEVPVCVLKPSGLVDAEACEGMKMDTPIPEQYRLFAIARGENGGAVVTLTATPGYRARRMRREEIDAYFKGVREAASKGGQPEPTVVALEGAGPYDMADLAGAQSIRYGVTTGKTFLATVMVVGKREWLQLSVALLPNGEDAAFAKRTVLKMATTMKLPEAEIAP